MIISYYECDLDIVGRYLDLPHTPVFWSTALHYYNWYTFRNAAF